eukprot:m.23390 g.23390  ORF g.23390 m.23390 type:complete len:367 (-) comp8973_c0_seq1:682-1782(-)
MTAVKEECEGEDVCEHSEEEQEEEEEGNGWTDVLGSGRLLRKIIREGDGTPLAPQSLVQVSFSVLETEENGGAQLRDKSSITMQVGDGESHAVLDIVLPLMKVGQCIQANISKDLTDFEDIPNRVVFEIEVEKIEETFPPQLDLILPEVSLRLAERKRAIGNSLFKSNKYDRASAQYRKGLSYLFLDEEEDSNLDFGNIQSAPDGELEKKQCIFLWQNLGLSELKAKRFMCARNICDTILAAESDNIKALFIKSKCLLSMNEPEKAMVTIKKGMTVKKQEFAPLLASAKAMKKENVKTSNSLYSKMGQALAPSPSKSRNGQGKDGGVNNSTWRILKDMVFSTWGLISFGLPLLIALVGILFKNKSG